MKISIEKVKNGYIVRWIKTGLSVFKDPYIKDILVFKTLIEVAEYLKLNLEGSDNPK